MVVVVIADAVVVVALSLTCSQLRVRLFQDNSHSKHTYCTVSAVWANARNLDLTCAKVTHTVRRYHSITTTTANQPSTHLTTTFIGTSHCPPLTTHTVPHVPTPLPTLYIRFRYSSHVTRAGDDDSKGGCGGCCGSTVGQSTSSHQHMPT